jgi:membrane protein DedA with SNARE-associated domain
MAVWEWIESFRELLTNFQAGIYPDFGTWSYILLALLVATEGPLSTLIGASASAAGLLDWRWVLTATIVGNIVGDCVWYFVGRAGRMQWLYDHGRWFGMHPHHVARLEREMRAHARKLIIFAKIAYGLIVPTLVAAGMARVPWRRWFPMVFVVETLWSILLVWVGFHTTAFIQAFEHSLQAIGVGVLVAAVIFVAMRFLRKRIDQQELELDPLNQETGQKEPVVASLESAKPVVESNGNGAGKVPEQAEGRSEIHRFVALPEREEVR